MKQFLRNLRRTPGRALARTRAAGGAPRPGRWCRLQGEELEARNLLAGDMLVGIRLETTDLSGTPVSSVNVGQTFVLRTWVEDLRGAANGGVFSAYMDVDYTSSRVAVVNGSLQHGSSYGAVAKGNTSAPSTIDEVGSLTSNVFAPPLGPGEFLLFSVQFTATGAGQVVFASNAADLPVNQVLLFGTTEAVAASQIDFGGTALSIILPESQIDLSLVVQPTSTDALGQVNTRPNSAPWIDEWQPIWVEVWVSTPASTATGVHSAAATFSYNTNYYTATTVQAGAAFAGNLTPSINDATGRVQLSGQTATGSVVGADKLVLLARVLLQPGSGDPGVPLDVTDPRAISPVSGNWLSLLNDGSASVKLGSGTAVGVAVGGSPNTDLYPVPYDLNNDGRISFGDLSVFAAAFLKNVGENAATYKADFDGSGRVSFGDFSILVSNFLKSRTSASPVIYPANYPNYWQPLSIAAAGPAASLGPVEPLTEAELAPIVEEAIARLTSHTPEAAAVLAGVSVEIVDLGGNMLGQASSGTIRIDLDAAGFGWFIDASPADDLEFGNLGYAGSDSPAYGRVDLLSVVMHELGHVLGYEHTSGHGIMDATLPTGARRVPDADLELGELSESDNEALDVLFASWGNG